MATRKDLVIAVLATFCLTSALFMTTSTRSQDIVPGQYDPWIDLDDDGVIGGLDAGYLGLTWGTSGTPINKTALLLELQSKIDSLNASLLALEAYLNTKINSLNATLTSRINDLETMIDILNATKLGKPDYDSGWKSLTKGIDNNFTHNLNTTNVFVYVIGKDVDGTYDIHQYGYGGDVTSWDRYGAAWLNLTENEIKVRRENNDTIWDEVRIMIWIIPED